jgi:hypothetical protein
MDPFTAAVLLGAATSLIGMQQANQQARAQAKAGERAQDQAVKNKNQLVEQSFEKRKRALGLGEQGNPNPLAGNQASQSGTILTSVTGDNNATGI